MLAIRLQRTGRSGEAQFRVIVQDARTSPKRGKIVAYVGSYDPHTKKAVLNAEKISEFLKNGAQPSDRVAGLLKTEKIKLPEWFAPAPKKSKTIRNAEKLRRNRPAGAPAPEPKAEEPASESAPTEEVAAESASADVKEPKTEVTTETKEPEAAAEPAEAEKPAEEPEESETPAEPAPDTEAEADKQ